MLEERKKKKICKQASKHFPRPLPGMEAPFSAFNINQLYDQTVYAMIARVYQIVRIVHEKKKMNNKQ